MNIVIPGLKSFSPALLIIATTLAYGANSKAAEQAGAILFRDKGCAYCHGAAGEGTKKAPSLVDIRSNKAWPPEKMTDQILNGGKKMPPFRESLSDDEIAQLIAYLRAKHRPVPPPLPDGAAPAPPPN
ncbi:MAG TPA: cytochrome c [Terracidiphilus sp.]|jgi:mono/diheme cytochrome c family protein|nr:cytochrome c [Terracidiphilus sp.]